MSQVITTVFHFSFVFKMQKYRIIDRLMAVLCYQLLSSENFLGSLANYVVNYINQNTSVYEVFWIRCEVFSTSASRSRLAFIKSITHHTHASTYEGTFSTDQSLLSTDSVHKVDSSKL